VPDPFDNLSEEGASAIRRELRYVRVVLTDGTQTFRLTDGKSVDLTDGGLIGDVHVHEVHFYHCRHPSDEPLGGQCAEPGCSNVSCRKCFADNYCVTCLKPCCYEHVNLVTWDGETRRLCGRCLSQARRRRTWKTLFGALVSPFVGAEKKQ